jgi:hypothetical protein
MTNSDLPTVYEELYYSFEYFYHMDCANSAIHMTDVKFSPITFRLANLLPGVTENVQHVHSHKGKYETDPGR